MYIYIYKYNGVTNRNEIFNLYRCAENICEKRIDEKDLNTYLDKGWTKGKIKGYKQVKRKYRPQIAVFNSKSNVEKHIPKNTINEFLVENPLFIIGSKPRKKYKTRQNQK